MSVTVDQKNSQKNRRICGGLTALLSLVLLLISASATGQPGLTRNLVSHRDDAALARSREPVAALALPSATRAHVPAPTPPKNTHCEIFFQSNQSVKYELNPEEKECLDGLIGEFNKLLDEKRDVKLKVYGHRHPTPTEKANLSHDRAESFIRYLIGELGIAVERVIPHDFGDTCPHREKKNRRIQVWIVPQGKDDPEDEDLKKCLQKASSKTNRPERSATSSGIPPS